MGYLKGIIEHDILFPKPEGNRDKPTGVCDSNCRGEKLERITTMRYMLK